MPTLSRPIRLGSTTTEARSFAANTGGEYYDGHETKTAIYLSDDWQVTNRWWLSAGVRGEYYSMGGRNAMAYPNATDETPTYTENIRGINYCVKNSKVTQMTNRIKNYNRQL